MISNNSITYPIDSRFHLFESELGYHLLLANGSQVYDIDEELSRQLRQVAINSDNDAVDELLEQCSLNHPRLITDEPPEIKLYSLSLAVAQKCNLGCTYCYAQEGTFGGMSKNMSSQVAFSSVDQLLSDKHPGEKINLTFLGGEPLVNRAVIYETTIYAEKRAKEQKVEISFSITTNGTLIKQEDINFFEKFGFAVTVSLDGIDKKNDRLRSYKNGKGSYEDVIYRITPLLKTQHKMQVSARVTLTPENLSLRETLDEFINMGFHSVGFSPMLSSPTGKGQMNNDDLMEMLDQMIECGKEFERHITSGIRYPFTNMVNAMRELHKGTHRPYPCGAGAGYLGVSADGDLAACHRFVGDEVGAMGNIFDGIDQSKQDTWLANRHVHFQEPCKSCWARYLCGGGCHHEVIHRGRPACDYIRGWLHYCLQAYVRLLDSCPEYFGVTQQQEAF